MWMTIWSPLLVVAGLVGAATAGAAATISLNPPASNALMVFVLSIAAVQGVISIALVGYGVWRPMRNWWLDRRTAH